MYCLFTSYNFRQNCEDFKLTIEPNPQNLLRERIILVTLNIIFQF
jgi:hypothetical protein